MMKNVNISSVWCIGFSTQGAYNAEIRQSSGPAATTIHLVCSAPHLNIWEYPDMKWTKWPNIIQLSTTKTCPLKAWEFLWIQFVVIIINLRCRQRWQTLHHDNSQFSVPWEAGTTFLNCVDTCRIWTWYIYLPGERLKRCFRENYRKIFNIRRTFVGHKIVDHSDVVGASPVSAAPTTSSFST